MRFVASMFMVLAATSVANASDDPITRFFKGLAPKIEKQIEYVQPTLFKPKRIRTHKHYELSGYGQQVKATWYKKGHHTANGDRFNPYGMTAAHGSLKFGTLVKVVHNKTGKSVVVKITDRGVIGNKIDLSLGAAQKLGIVSQGAASVSLSAL